MAPQTPSSRLPFLGGNNSGGDARFYLEHYIGVANAGSVLATDVEARLPDNPCKYVMLANWNSDITVTQEYFDLSGESLYENNGREIYYGFGGVLCLQLFQSQNSGLLPVNNTNQIVFKARPGQSMHLWYAWFY